MSSSTIDLASRYSVYADPFPRTDPGRPIDLNTAIRLETAHRQTGGLTGLAAPTYDLSEDEKDTPRAWKPLKGRTYLVGGISSAPLPFFEPSFVFTPADIPKA